MTDEAEAAWNALFPLFATVGSRASFPDATNQFRGFVAGYRARAAEPPQPASVGGAEDGRERMRRFALCDHDVLRRDCPVCREPPRPSTEPDAGFSERLGDLIDELNEGIEQDDAERARKAGK